MLSTLARIILGVTFVVFGLNGFLHFLPNPPMPEAAGAFLGALAATKYMFPLIKATEVVSGLLLLTGVAVPFALVLLAPVIVNIVAFHAFLAPAGLPIPLAALVLGVYLAWSKWGSYRSLFK